MSPEHLLFERKGLIAIPSLLYAGNRDPTDPTAEITVASGTVLIGTVGVFTAAEQQLLSSRFYLNAPGSAGVVQTTAGVAPVNDVQTVSLGTPSAGTFTLTFGGQTTSGVAFNATAATLQTALQALIGSGNCTVSGAAGGPYTVTFVGALAGAPQSVMTINGAGLTGGTPSVAHTTTGVVGVSAVQTITIFDYPGDQFWLSFGGVSSGPLRTQATQSDVQAALIALPGIGSGNVAVAGNQGGPFTVTFQGTLANAPQALIALTGADSSTIVDETQFPYQTQQQDISHDG